MRTRITKTRSDKNTLIRITFWINVAIIVLASYTIRNIPENALFAGVAYTCSSLWLTAYVVANFEEKRPSTAGTADSPDAPKSITTQAKDTTKEATVQ